MKVLLRRNVTKLGQIGEIVEVQPGYARNYLLPQGLAFVPTAANLKRVEEEKQAYLAELARIKAELQTQANLLSGKECTIEALANEEGHLYGSVGPAQVAAAIAAEGILIEADNILLDEPIRQLDQYEVRVRFAEDVHATITVWVVPPHDQGEPAPAQAAEGEPPQDREAPPCEAEGQPAEEV